MTCQPSLNLDAGKGALMWPARDLVLADRPCVYSVSGFVGAGNPMTAHLVDRHVEQGNGTIRIEGRFDALPLELAQVFQAGEAGWCERISMRNAGELPIRLTDIGIGFACCLAGREDWRLCAVPFRVQLDGGRHDYSGANLLAGECSNAVFRDGTRVEPDLVEGHRLRSEAWLWWNGKHGMLVAKYNPNAIELSVAARVVQGEETLLRFGGVGMSLYGEPAGALCLEPGESITFGASLYGPVEGSVQEAFYRYRELLDQRGHGCPTDYDPPLNWNELYDVGWHHSEPAALAANYTREALLREAKKARDCHCQLLYLDPGWEVAEGTTRWAEERLGSLATLGDQLRSEFGLQFGFRTILRGNSIPPDEAWPEAYLVRHANGTRKLDWFGVAEVDELCLCNQEFREAKIARIDAICRDGGMRFLMVDEMDWRGPCYDPGHGHPVPTTASDHVNAVYELCRELRRRHPELVIECHDPVWPWKTCIYAPTYYGQGFETGAYQENWGFEYMWDCINDLRSGRALALYYYNLACSIPLYLHITMAADNDNAVFFWWAASTVRHLGIGGKYNHPSLNPKNMADFDPEARFALYERQTALYRELKPWLVRGTFVGIDEHIHLHVLTGRPGGVLAIFNLHDDAEDFHIELTPEQLGANGSLPVRGATCTFRDGVFHVELRIPAMAPAVVRLGDAAGETEEPARRTPRRP